MKNLVIILIAVTITSCSFKDPNERTSNGIDIVFSFQDNENNELNIGIMSNYNLTNKSLWNLESKYGDDYKNNYIIPTVERISRTNLKSYSPGDIYNYKRPEIEQEIVDQTRAAFDSVDVELTKLFITTVKIPDDLMERLEREHVEKMKDKN